MQSPVAVFAAVSSLMGLLVACSAAAPTSDPSSSLPSADAEEVRRTLFIAKTDLCVGRGPGLSGICLHRSLSHNGICAAPAPYEIRGFADPTQAAADLAAATAPRAPGAPACRRGGFYFDGTACTEASPATDACRCDGLDCALWRTRAMCELARKECAGGAGAP